MCTASRLDAGHGWRPGIRITDGLWEFVANQEVAATVARVLAAGDSLGVGYKACRGSTTVVEVEAKEI